MAHYGVDTAAVVTTTLADQVNSYFGTAGSFWVRYFSPSPNADVINSSSGRANGECSNLFTRGFNYLVPISEPTQSRLSGTTAMGHADAQTFCNAIANVYLWVGPLLLPSPVHLVYVYLGIESSTPLSHAYWSGWASYVNTFNFFGTPALFPSIYCNPNSSQPNCSTAVNPSAWTVWSSEPETCSNCGAFGTVSWNPDTCFNGLPTHLWQMAEDNLCRVQCNRTTRPHVDTDEGNLSNQDTMFYISANP